MKGVSGRPACVPWAAVLVAAGVGGCSCGTAIERLDAGRDAFAASDAFVASDRDAREDAPLDAGPVPPPELDPLTAPTPGTLDGFGGAVALSAEGSLAVVGAPGDDTGGTDAGSAHVFARQDDGWVLVATLRPSDGAAGDRFGSALSLDPLGFRLVIGAPGDDTVGGADAGSAHVFGSETGSWLETATLLAPDGAAGDAFGTSVALASDGRVLVGAPGDDTSAGADAGSVHEFLADPAYRPSGMITRADASAGDRFGTSVACDYFGGRALVGASGALVDGVSTGAAFGFAHIGSAWTLEGTLVPSDARAGDALGHAIALNVDATVALVGAPGDDTARGVDAGSVRVFTRLGGTSTWVESATLSAAEGAAGDGLGSSVAGCLGLEPACAIVGAPGADGAAGQDTGSAHVFDLVSGVWTRDVVLLAEGAQPGDGLGGAVAITAQRDLALVGAPLDDLALVHAGTVRSFRLAP